MQDNDASFLFVSPNYSQSVSLPTGKALTAIDIPDKFRNANVYVEVVGKQSDLPSVVIVNTP